MPVYEFRCPKCGKETELQRSVSDTSVPLCCEDGCGAIEMVQLISRSSFHLVGGGWAADGYGKGKS